MMTKTLALRMAVIALTSSVAVMATAQTLPERVGITVGTLGNPFFVPLVKGAEAFLLRLDAPLVRVPKVDIQLTSAIHKDIPLLKALAPAIRSLSGEIFL